MVAGEEGLGHALLTIVIVLLIAFGLPFVMAWLEPSPEQRTRLEAKRSRERQQARLRVKAAVASEARSSRHA